MLEDNMSNVKMIGIHFLKVVCEVIITIKGYYS